MISHLNINVQLFKKDYNSISEDTAGKYTCTVTKGDLTETTKEVEVIVQPTPTVKITEADGKASYYQNLEAQDQSGDIFLKSDELGKAMTLNLDIENQQPETTIRWYKNTTESEYTTAAQSTTLNVPAADVASGTSILAVVTPKDLPALTFTATFKETSGKLEGDVLTSSNGGKSFTKNAPYTITLPTGLAFQDATAGSKNLADYGVTIESPTTTGLAIDSVEVKAATTSPAAPATLTFKYASTNADAVASPVVGPMKVKVNAVKGEGRQEIYLPVSDAVGYKVTLPAATAQLNFDTVDGKPVAHPEVEKQEATYTGKPIAVTAKAAADVEGLGTIKNYRYATVNDVTKATGTAPTDVLWNNAHDAVQPYYVFCDIEEGTNYGAQNNVLVGELQINPVTLEGDATQYEKNAPYFTITPPQNVYNGKNQEPKVAFAADVAHAGKIDKIKYMQGTTEVTPLNVGKYDVYVSTVADTADTSGLKNINPTTTTATDNFVKVGEYEITKKQPTADLYTMKPTEVTYNEAEQGTNVTKVDEKAGDVAKVLYYAEGSDEPLEGLPVEAGKYTVMIETKENDTYAAATGDDALKLGTFTIKEAKPAQQDVYMIGHVENIGWGEDEDKDNKGDGKAVKLEAGKTAQVGTTGRSLRVEAVTILVPEDYTVEGFAHVQDIGDKNVEALKAIPDYITNASDIPEGYKAYMFGTQGQAKRVEAVNIGIKDADGKYVEGFEYATHVQNQGWLGSVRNGSFSGSRRQALRMEAIRFYYDDVVRKPTDIDAETK